VFLQESLNTEKVMKYQYQIYVAGITIATFSTDGPLPHIQAGHFLELETREFSTKPGCPLEIERVEVAYRKNLRIPSNPARVEISIHCREAE